ncbi:MAG: ABC transporter ATP-binding protein, partial [Gemmatimonadales bacterium]
MTALEKRFGAVRANRGANLEVRQGEIHALVGENGAGKSTLMRVLSGMYPCDAGTIEVGGRDVTGWTTAQAIGAGVGMVHQHFMLVPTLTVAENVVLGREPVSVGIFDRARAVREVEALCEQSGLRVSPERLVADLSVGEAQRVEILKTLYRGARVLLLDEPTAVLSPPEVKELWNVLRRVRDGGATIVLITHKLDEVMDVSANVTVMRQGETVARMATRETTPEGIAKAMVGRDVDLTVREERRAKSEETSAALEVRNLVVRGARVERAVNDVSFTVAPGEVLGIAGVEGNGQTVLLEAIAGLRAVTGGSVLLGGRDIT